MNFPEIFDSALGIINPILIIVGIGIVAIMVRDASLKKGHILITDIPIIDIPVQPQEHEEGQIITGEECNGNYEAAMHYDCDVCSAECSLRKGGAKSSEMIAGMCFIGIITIIVAVAVGTGANYLLKMLGI